MPNTASRVDEKNKLFVNILHSWWFCVSCSNVNNSKDFLSPAECNKNVESPVENVMSFSMGALSKTLS